jgi:hypothetical protein
MPTISDKIATTAGAIYRIAGAIVLWGGIALLGFLLFPLVSDYVSRPGVIAIVVALNVLATILLWQESKQTARKPPRPNKKFLNELFHSEPITPKHDPPKEGGNFSSLASDDDKRFFADFAPFANVVNSWLAGKYVESCWRLQDLPDWTVLLNVDHSYGPAIGRCFEIFHNQVKLGRLEIQARYNYSPETPHVITEVHLHSVRLLSFESITEFLRIIAMFVCDQKAQYEDGDFCSNVNQAISTALTEALWQTQEISEFDDLDGQDWGELSLHLDGQASSYYFKEANNLRELARQRRHSSIRADTRSAPG